MLVLTPFLLLAIDFRLLFYTDGISEALNPDNQEFGACRLAEFVAGCPRSGRFCETWGFSVLTDAPLTPFLRPA